MAEGSERKQLNKNGILIHELPLIYADEVLNLDCFSTASIFYHFHDRQGLHIYFCNPDKVTEWVNYRTIQVRDHEFYIYIKVTNLTIHGLATYTDDINELRELIISKGFKDIVDLYPVYVYEENDRHRTCIIQTDYRLILNVPEIFYPYNLRPIPRPGMPDVAFPVSFYCRLCHKNGHKTFECVTRFKEDSNFQIGRNRTHESYSQDLRALNMRHSERRREATNPVDPETTPTCSYSAASHSSYFNVCVTKTEPGLNKMGGIHESTERQPEPETSNPQPRLQREVNLSEGIKEAIAKLKDGVELSPDKLIILLNHVRRRKNKKLMEIALSNTKNISGLIRQLQLVKVTYYNSVEIRGEDEDRDIIFLDNLQERLKKQMNSSSSGSDSD